MNASSNQRYRMLSVRLALAGSIAACTVPTAVVAQVSLGGDTATAKSVPICRVGTDIYLVTGPLDECSDLSIPSTPATGIFFGPENGQQRTYIADDGTADFAYQTYFDGPTQFNGNIDVNAPIDSNASVTAKGLVSTSGMTNTGSFTNHGAVTVDNGLTAASLGAGSATITGQINTGSLVATGGLSGAGLSTTGAATIGGFLSANNGASILGTTQLGTVRVFQGLTIQSASETVDMGGARVQNVGAPTAATDAANKAYVDAATGGAAATANLAIAHEDALGQDTAAALGGGAAYDPATGHLSSPTYKVGTTNYSSVGTALAAANTSGLAYFHSNSTQPDGSATGANAVAVGAGTSASGDNSVALGSGSVATVANTVSVGSATSQRRIVNVAAGTAPSDAATVAQLAASGTAVAAALGGGSTVGSTGVTSAPTYTLGGVTYHDVGSALVGLSAGMDQLSGVAFDIRKEERRGIAAAVAMANAPMPSAPGRTSWATNAATFHGEVGFGGSLAHRFDTGSDASLAVTAGFAYAPGGNSVAKVGMAGEF